MTSRYVSNAHIEKWGKFLRGYDVFFLRVLNAFWIVRRL